VSATVPLVIDRTLSAFTVTPAEFSPNGDGRDDTVTFGFHLSRAAQVRVDVKRGAKLVTNVLNATDAAGDQSVVWNGSTSSGRARDGSYTVLVTAASAIATTAQSLPVRVDTARPKLRAISFRRLVFWISEPARVTLVVNGRRHVLVVRAGVFSLHVRGRVRQVRASAEDPAGNVSRRLRFH
jgi:hypothetical protein